jgi:hypothetical protein
MTPRCKTSRKHRWPTEAKALQVAANSAKRRGDTLRTYRCPDCGDWHLTSTPDRYIPTEGDTDA